MNLLFSKVFRINNLSISVSSHAILFVWCGKKRIRVKSIRGDIRKFIRVSSIVMSLFVLVVVTGLTAYKTTYHDTAIDEDNLQKAQILKSSTTEYVEPQEIPKLQIREHKVKQGETLAQIARMYRVSVDTICGSNNLTTYDNPRTGTVLKIPNIDGILYRMRRGTSLVEIARTYRVSLEKILDHNDIKNADFVASGTVLFIPDAKPRNIFDGFIWPITGGGGRLTSGFGWRRSPFNPGTREHHAGIDIGVPNGTWVRASRYGRVTYTGWMGGYGNTVIVSHPNGYKTLYAHLSSSIVNTGQYVRQGQNIARSGNTGRSTGPHLHFEVIRNGKQRNPMTYVRRR